MSTLEHSTQKPGIICISGNVECGVNWGVHVLDHVIYKLRNSDQSTLVCHLLTDRNVTKSSDHRNLSKSSEKDQNIMRAYGDEDLKAIIEIISIQSQDLQKSALIVDSFSEVVLRLGFIESLEWIRKLVKIGFRTVIILIHSTLHTIAEISAIQNLSNIIVNIRPNTMGIYDPSEVAIIIQIIQRSLATGKVSEDYDLFGFIQTNLNIRSQEKKLIYLPKHKSLKHQKPKPDSSSPSTTNLEISEGGGSSSQTLEIEQQKHQQEKALESIQKINDKNLFTFDADDPDFDEDEDPDADLDL